MIENLHTLCSLAGVQTAYTDVEGQRRQAQPAELMAVLRSLGVRLTSETDVPRAIATLKRRRWRRPLEPVVVAWEDRRCEAVLRLPASYRGRVECRLEREDGEVTEWQVNPGRLEVMERQDAGGETFAARRLVLPGPIPAGYHRLVVDAGARRRARATVISSPRRAFAPPRAHRRAWGVFAPCYALHSEHSTGVGDLGDLEKLLRWTRERGGSTVGTLPLLAAYLDAPFDHSPYSPVSRRYWNELYLDLAAIPEMESAPDVRQRMGTRRFQTALHELGDGNLVDYPRAMAFKRELLERLARRFFRDRDAARFTEFRRFLRRKRDVERYARFRAVAERRRTTWQEWPERMREGTFRPGDHAVTAERYHQYVQFVAHEQMDSLAAAGGDGAGLYLDLPLGVHGGGYDVWCHRDQYLEGVSAGAPPDTFFTRGQNWGFPPPHPLRSRERGYAHLRDVIRHHMRVAGTLRIDHIMGLHRLYCVPHGADAADGVYVRYPADELYALVTLESHRNRTVVVGEDLGTVPREVRLSMGRHGIHRTYVVQYEAGPEKEPLAKPAGKSVASLNTHDMPTFNAFWRGLDVRDRADLGLLDRAGAAEERRARKRLREALVRWLVRRGRLETDTPRASEALRALLGELAAGPAWMVLVNLEDLWGEASPQNVPGTSTERPNWQRKMRCSLEAIMRKPIVARMLATVNENRRKV